MIDLHCHILPGVDDGAGSLEEAAAMCRLAARDGCTAMVATPHQRRGEWWNCDRQRLSALTRRLQAEVGREIQIFLGAEVHVDAQLLDDVERLPGHGGILGLAGSRYLLIEFPPFGSPPAAEDLVHELVVAGWRPVVAHPELIPWLAADLDAVAQLIALGASTQVTAMSVTGDFGKRAQQQVWALLDAGLVHFLASDAHGIQRRPPGLRAAADAVAQRLGPEAARQLVADHPRAVLEDRPLPEILAARAV
jgi:protein-tyrosine phosphatase